MMKKLFLIIIFLYSTCVFSFADDPKLKLECRYFDGDVETDIFFETDEILVKHINDKD